MIELVEGDFVVSDRVKWKPVRGDKSESGSVSRTPAGGSERERGGGRGVPAWLFLAAPVAVVAVATAFAFVLWGGRPSVQEAQSGQSIAASGGNRVAVNDGGLLGFYGLVRDRHPQPGDTPSGDNGVDHESQGAWVVDAGMDGRTVRAWLDDDGVRVGVDGWPRWLVLPWSGWRSVQGCALVDGASVLCPVAVSGDGAVTVSVVRGGLEGDLFVAAQNTRVGVVSSSFADARVLDVFLLDVPGGADDGGVLHVGVGLLSDGMMVVVSGVDASSVESVLSALSWQQ